MVILLFFFLFLNLSFGEGGIKIDLVKGIKYKIGYIGYIVNNNYEMCIVVFNI